MMDGNFSGWGGMIFGPFFMLLIFGLVIAFFVLLVRWIADSGSRGSGRPQSSLEILEKRFAAGEISKEEFEDMRKTIRQ